MQCRGAAVAWVPDKGQVGACMPCSCDCSVDLALVVVVGCVRLYVQQADEVRPCGNTRAVKWWWCGLAGIYPAVCAVANECRTLLDKTARRGF